MAWRPLCVRARASSPFDSGLAGAGLVYINGDSKSDETGKLRVLAADLPIDLAQRSTHKTWTCYNDAELVGARWRRNWQPWPLTWGRMLPHRSQIMRCFNIGANEVEAMPVEEGTWKANLRTRSSRRFMRSGRRRLFTCMLPWRGGYNAASDTLSVPGLRPLRESTPTRTRGQTSGYLYQARR